MARGSHRRWRNLRAAILATSDTCWICGNPGADTVDHIIPVAQRPDLEYEPSNLRPAHGRKRPDCGGNFARHNNPTRALTSRAW